MPRPSHGRRRSARQAPTFRPHPNPSSLGRQAWRNGSRARASSSTATTPSDWATCAAAGRSRAFAGRALQGAVGADPLRLADHRQLRLPRARGLRAHPGVIKLHSGEYKSLGLHIELDQTMAMRAAIIRHTAEAFRPDLFLVDKEPLGLKGEVVPTLQDLKARGTHLVLGLRDIMDEPAMLSREWEHKHVMPALTEALRRDLGVRARGARRSAGRHRLPAGGARQGRLHRLHPAHAAVHRASARAPVRRRALPAHHRRRRRRRHARRRLGASGLRARSRHSHQHGDRAGPVHEPGKAAGIPRSASIGCPGCECSLSTATPNS
ncbi:MAG: hypothetical protein MZW92_32320 [Comamonadaceae bacterium]|nr:hypothetical protein [Comamonadaceae bacterium]